MNFTEKAIWAEIKYNILLAALHIENGESNDLVLSKLLEVVSLLENTEPNGGEKVEPQNTYCSGGS
ncbi:hypothetical protein MKX67_18520 [Cytobacillus sp. FSL W7-1323]|uniref:hypothetical protein n=1 Tax=Cytobacillus sp. FSL W7-1323 TaxID=2921700 RepID=UPI0031595D61